MTAPAAPAADSLPPAPAARRGVVAAVVGLTALLFLLDLQTPVGMASWLAYLAVVLLALTVPDRRVVLAATLAVSLLTAADYYLSPPGGDPGRAAVNRALGVGVFWATAGAGLALRRTAALERANARLVREIEERRRLEAHVLRVQRLESVGVLAGGLAHDFNNLLTPILMATKLLREDRPAAERAELVDTLQAAAERGAELVRKLLAFAGGTDAGRAAVDVRAAVAEVRGIVSHTFPKGISLDVRLADDLPPAAADPTGLAQVRMNLCVNARDAMPAGGTLGVEAAALDLAAGDPALSPDAAPGRYVRLTVTDTGTGIAPDVLDRVFDPFFTTKGPGRGTGLGLATVAGIVRGHGGFVAVASTPGAGSRFDVLWPAADRAALAPADPPPTPPPLAAGGRPLVLVVDDEPPILATARTVLEAAGCRVATAADGAAALAVYRRERPAVRAVVLDAMMPGMEGAATLAALDRLDPGCRVVVTSGRRPAGPLADAVRAGRVGFLPKPYTAAQLLAALAGSVPN